MDDVLLLKEYVSSVLSEAPGRRTARRKLTVFDFDDTLVRSRSMVRVVTAAGEKFQLTPGEYAVYDKQPGDVMDYSDFSRLVDPQEIKWTLKILRNISTAGGTVAILTARGPSAREPIQKFLSDAGLPPMEVVTLGDSDPVRKAKYIADRIEMDGFDYVEFFDDSHKNVAAVAALRPEYPDVTIVPRLVTHKTGIS